MIGSSKKTIYIAEMIFESFESADDVLTLLIHLGYLTYHETEKTGKHVCLIEKA